MADDGTALEKRRGLKALVGLFPTPSAILSAIAVLIFMNYWKKL